MNSRNCIVLLLFGVSGGVACGDRKPSAVGATDLSTRPSAAELKGISPDSTLRLFLSLTIPGRPPGTVNISPIYECADVEELDKNVWLADSRIDSTSDEGDTIVYRVNLTTVARQENSGAGFVATLKAEERPVQFSVIRGPDRWRVCANAFDGTEVFTIGSAKPNTRWLPEGASAEKALALIDSIRSARGLPRIR